MMQPWFQQARLGIFLHWGIYSVAGVEASWSFRHYGTPQATGDPAQYLSYEDYMALAERFTAARYDPRAWARFFKSLGAGYAVLTAKHHDGFALWPTAHSPLNIAATPARRDLVVPFCEALRAEGLRVGLYISHMDWSHLDYADYTRKGGGSHAHPGRWPHFIDFHRSQIREICERYQPDLLWFDGEFERTPAQWNMGQLAEQIRRWCPRAVLNSRIGTFGDYQTVEQALPLRPPAGPWEFCATLNHQWGYSPDNTQLKPAHHLTRMLMESVSMGGNLLLNIGPREDGTFDPGQQQRLEQLGGWVQRNREGLFGTLPGLPPGYFYGANSLGADRRTLYACFFDAPTTDVAIKGLRNKIVRVRRVDGGGELPFRVEGGAPWHNIPGTLWIDVADPDPLGTVVAIELADDIDLYTG